MLDVTANLIDVLDVLLIPLLILLNLFIFEVLKVLLVLADAVLDAGAELADGQVLDLDVEVGPAVLLALLVGSLTLALDVLFVEGGLEHFVELVFEYSDDLLEVSPKFLALGPKAFELLRVVLVVVGRYDRLEERDLVLDQVLLDFVHALVEVLLEQVDLQLLLVVLAVLELG